MYRINYFGKVGYFEHVEQACDFAYQIHLSKTDDEILNEFRIDPDKAKRSFLLLKKLDTKRIFRNFFIFTSHIGVECANYFMNFRYGLNVIKKKSVLEGLRNERIFKYCVKSYYKMNKTHDFDGAHKILDVANIRGGLQELSNYPPSTAKSLYERYCPKGGQILDISSGFGGRLTAAMSSKNNYSYTGVDPSTRAIENVNKLIDFINCKDRAKVIELPFEESDKELKDDFYDFLFTSPPYFNKEIYSDEPTQSCNKFQEIDAWVNGFLQKSFDIAFRKLKKNTYMMINIADIKNGKEVIKLGEYCIRCAEKAGFIYDGFDKMMISNRFKSLKTKNRPKGRESVNYEPIYRFKKS